MSSSPAGRGERRRLCMRPSDRRGSRNVALPLPSIGATSGESPTGPNVDMLDQRYHYRRGRRLRVAQPRSRHADCRRHRMAPDYAPYQYCRSTDASGSTGNVSCRQKSSASAIRRCRSRSSAARRRSISCRVRRTARAFALALALALASSPSRRSSASTSSRGQPAWQWTISPRGPSRSAKVGAVGLVHRAAAAVPFATSVYAANRLGDCCRDHVHLPRPPASGLIAGNEHEGGSPTEMDEIVGLRIGQRAVIAVHG